MADVSGVTTSTYDEIRLVAARLRREGNQKQAEIPA
jgi:hypothetical protein